MATTRNTKAAAKAAAPAPAVKAATGVNQFAREVARMGSADYPHAGDRYHKLAMALGELVADAKPGTTKAVRYAQVNALTGSTRGNREGCDVGAQWARGLRRLYTVYGAAGLATFGVADVSHDASAGTLAITRG